MKTFRKVAALTALVLSMGGLFACGASAPAGGTAETGQNSPAPAAQQDAEKTDRPEVVNIGVQTLVTPELIARKQDIYEEYLGCRVNLVQFDSGADVNRAFAAGAIDIGAIGTSPVAIGIANGLGYEVIWYHDVIGSAESLVAAPDSGISSVADLIGKKVATPFASTAHYSLLNAIELAGVDPAEVELLDMQPDDIFAAWTRGDIDAAYVWDPVLSSLLETGTRITGGDELSEQGVVTADLAVVNKAFAEAYPEVVAGYVKAQIEATELFYTDEATGLSHIAEMAGITPEEAKSQTAGFIYPRAEEQLSDQYLGTSEKPGELAQTLEKTAVFLQSQHSIETVPESQVFTESVTGGFVERAMGK